MSTFTVAEGFFPDTAGVGSFIGPTPRLATADADTSYAQVDYIQGFAYAGVRLSPSTAKVPTLTVTIQISASHAIGFYEIYLNRLTSGGGLGDNLELTNENTSVTGRVNGGMWVTHTFNLRAGVDYDQADLEAALAAGRLAVLVSADAADEGIQYLRLSQLLVGGVEKWLRGVQRNDGLSHSVPRGVQVSSRQRSLRGVGYQ